MKKEILVVFKTHLDIGFTDFAKIYETPCFYISAMV